MLLFILAFFVGTVPKAGSHLLDKALKEIHQTPEKRYFSHLAWFDYDAPIEPSIVLIRDPRDIFVSLFDWLERTREKTPLLFDVELDGQAYFTYCRVVWLRPKWDLLRPEQKLLALINLDEDVCLSIDSVFPRNFERASLLLQQPGVTVVRFENLVGAEGGGSSYLQQEELKKLASAYGLTLSEKRIREIATSLWGGKETFHKGKIGRWREVFKREHVEAFKKKWNHTLLEWGYETSADWGIDSKRN